MAIKTNLASWAALITPNIELEAYLGSRYSVSYTHLTEGSRLPDRLRFTRYLLFRLVAYKFA